MIAAVLGWPHQRLFQSRSKTTLVDNSEFVEQLRASCFSPKGVYRLWDSMRRSYNRSSLAVLRTTLWRFGLQPLVVPPVHKAVTNVAPGLLRVRRKFKQEFPKWIIPDANLRRRIDEARTEEHARKQHATGGFYLRDMRMNLDHQIVSWEAEELFEVYRRCGVRILQPFWDADLVDLLYRMPPMSLIHDGRNKGLVRASLARRFPELGFDRQKKIEAGSFYRALIAREAAPLWREARSAKLLDELGIIDERRFRSTLEQTLVRPTENSGNHIWSVLNLEMWARAHAS